MKIMNFVNGVLVIGASLLFLMACDIPSLTVKTVGPTAVSVEPSDWSRGTVATAGWVLAHFGTNGSSGSVADDSLHIAYSLDGTAWKTLKYNKAIHSTTIGTGHLRDPMIFRKNDGSFVLLATDWTLAGFPNDTAYWGHPSPYIYVADSTDLITFKNGRLLKLANALGTNTTPHAWAPEAVYDPDKQQYAILWSGNDETGANRIYVSYTSDFMSITNLDKPQIFFDPGYSVIDATVRQEGGTYYMAYKDETWDGATGRGKDLQMAVSSSLAPGSFTPQKLGGEVHYLTRGANQVQVDATEGPFFVKDPVSARWYLFADLFNKNGLFGLWSTTTPNDPASWARWDSTTFKMPYNVRHGNAFRVTQAELDNLKAKIGAPVGSVMIRTSYSEASGANIFYVAQRANLGYIAYDGAQNYSSTVNAEKTAIEDRAFYWKIVPSLADPLNPALASFESMDTPGQYLWVDSAAAYQVKVSADAGTVPFRTAASFAIVAALNGNASLVSIQWQGDITRYLIHGSYKVAAQVPVTAQNNLDSSFLLEAQ